MRTWKGPQSARISGPLLAPGRGVTAMLGAALAASCQLAPRPPSPTPEKRVDLLVPGEARDDPPSTFSIVAFDAQTGDLGVAVQSKFLAVGGVVPWAAAGVGAIATQSYANTSYGPRGLTLLEAGLAPQEALAKLTQEDPERDFRQVAAVDAKGRAAGFTGKRCLAWAGSLQGEGFSVQGNILVSEATLRAMAEGFKASRGELAERLLSALERGQSAGGDARGRQSAALLVVRKGAGYGGFNDRYIDLRVDDHTRPIHELQRVLELRLGKDPLTRSSALRSRDQLEEAIRELQEAAHAQPDDAALGFELARALFKAQRPDDAAQELSRALSLAPAYDHAHYEAARILATAGRKEEALAALRRLLEINSEYRHVLRRELDDPATELQGIREEAETLLRS